MQRIFGKVKNKSIEEENIVLKTTIKKKYKQHSYSVHKKK